MPTTIRSVKAKKLPKPSRLHCQRLEWNNIPASTRKEIKSYCKKRAQAGDGVFDIIRKVANKTWKGVKKYAPAAWEKVIKPIAITVVKDVATKAAKNYVKSQLGVGLSTTGGGLRLAGYRGKVPGGSLTMKGNGLTLNGSGRRGVKRKRK